MNKCLKHCFVASSALIPVSSRIGVCGGAGWGGGGGVLKLQHSAAPASTISLHFQEDMQQGPGVPRNKLKFIGSASLG